MRRSLSVSVFVAAISCLGCDAPAPPGDAGMDASAGDGGRVDAAGSDGGAREDAGLDAGAPPDSGPACGLGQHLCGTACSDPMPNEPSTGCRLGCGAPCVGGAEAVCNLDGTCGLRGCVAATCEELSVSCGTADNGCGRRISCGTCDAGLGQRCESGSCICDVDPYEPNEAPDAVPVIGSLTDEPDSSASITTGTLSRASDEDWYRWAIRDTGWGGNPQISVLMDGVPAGADYALAAYFACENMRDDSTCTPTRDDRIGHGCRTSGGTDRVEIATECLGTTDEHGTLYVRVWATTWTGSCASYNLRLNVN